jgi:transposase
MNLARELRNLGYSIDLYETRKLSKFLRIRRNKTDAGDASGIADAGRLGATTVSRVHLKSLECQSLQARLVIRKQLIRQRVAAVNILGRQLELFGGRLKSTKPKQLRGAVETETRRLFGRAGTALTAELLHLAEHCDALYAYQLGVDRELKQWASQHELCSRFMQIPGVGPLCALSFYSAVGDPFRFNRSADVGAYFGLVPRIHQSGMTLRAGRITKMGNTAVRTALVQASMTFMRFASADSPLRVWASAVEERRGRRKARVALARKLATVMLAMWRNGQAYQPHAKRPALPAERAIELGLSNGDEMDAPDLIRKEPCLEAVV